MVHRDGVIQIGEVGGGGGGGASGGQSGGDVETAMQIRGVHLVTLVLWTPHSQWSRAPRPYRSPRRLP
jgi:hypothetical protein